MGALIRLEDRAPDERMDFVREMTPAMWVPMEITAEGPDVYGELRASGVGAMRVVVMDMMPVTVSRSARHVEEADPDMLKLLLIGGTSPGVVNQGGKQAVLASGEFAFYDTRKPYDVTVGLDGSPRVTMMTFMFPPSMLPLSRDGIRDLAVTRMPAVGGLGELTAQFLLQLARNIDDCTAAEAARLSTAAMEVLATRLARELEVRDWGAHESRGHAMFTTIMAFILANLGDPGLSPMTIAAAHHISLRSLHRLFHDEGLTVAGWIKSRRLERCRRDLEDAALVSQPVAAIGARWGFPARPTSAGPSAPRTACRRRSTAGPRELPSILRCRPTTRSPPSADTGYTTHRRETIWPPTRSRTGLPNTSGSYNKETESSTR